MIKLTNLEKDFLLSNLELNDNDRVALKVESEINEDFADILRDKCINKLDYCGYDENYEPNKIGKELNKLIDKLFIG